MRKQRDGTHDHVPLTTLSHLYCMAAREYLDLLDMKNVAHNRLVEVVDKYPADDIEVVLARH